MRQYNNTIGYLLLVGIGLIVLFSTVQGQEYKDYKSSSSRKLLFEVFYTEEYFGYGLAREDSKEQNLFDHGSVSVRGHEVLADGVLLFDQDGIHTVDGLYRFDEISDIRVSRRKNQTTIGFYTRTGTSQRAGRLRRGNIIEPFNNVVVPEDDFVRGSVFSVAGNIEIYGEINRSVVSLFGDIFIGPNAVVRGDVASVKGRINLAGDAAVYGDIRSGSDLRSGRRHRFRRFRSRYSDMFDLSLGGVSSWYNRVDGLSLGLTLEFDNLDSVLPKIWIGASYAFESERWRYELGLEQSLLRSPGVAIGGKAFRRLASEDDWLLSSAENSTFALLAREDYKDYYETEGGAAYLRVKPLGDLRIETGVRYDETKWLDAERDLWSLFGGGGKFQTNFASVDSASRAVGMKEIDTGTNYSVYGSMIYDTRDRDDPYYHSAWTIKGMFEWSHPDIGSDFNYTRYRLSVTSHHKLSRGLMLIQRGMYGGSDGHLPMYKRFYLGGLGTLYGYEHKELSGNHFWLANIEYRVSFPHSDLATSLMWDFGQISEKSDFEASEVKHSLGVALYLGSDFKIGLAKRLDRSYDDKPKFFARFAYSL